MMNSLNDGYKAIVVGASGGIGSAIADALGADPACATVICLSRIGDRKIDLCDESSVVAAKETIEVELGSVDLIFNATGALIINSVPPEKTIKRLDPENMARHFQANAIGPALLLKHLAPLLPRDRRGLFASLSARVGSIGDNSLGGWFSYRASKAAQNQIVRTVAIEFMRTHPLAVLATLHPGTVATRLSEPFASGRNRLKAETSAHMLLQVLDSLTTAQSGGFFDYKGDLVDW